MVSLNVENLRKLINKLFIFTLSSILIYLILFGIGYTVRNIHVFSHFHASRYSYFNTPLLGAALLIALFMFALLLYIIAMIILSLIVNFLWKRNIIEFTDNNNKKYGFFEKILRYAWHPFD
jgi:preprotein translocase subunit SecY